MDVVLDPLESETLVKQSEVALCYVGDCWIDGEAEYFSNYISTRVSANIMAVDVPFKR